MTAGAGQAGDFEAIVLAGGRAARLGGADKPGLRVAGTPMLSSVTAVAGRAGAAAVIVVGPARPRLAGLPPGTAFVTEQPPGAGPVPALRRGLARAGHPVVALLAADLPFLTSGTLRLLLGVLAGEQGPAGAVLADDAGAPQWLVSCWQRAALSAAAADYPGTSLRGLLGPLRPALVRARPDAGQPPPWFDCDTAQQLALARRWAAAGQARPPGPARAETRPEAPR
ncbi:MAG TPA: NTP transferase domain-containing protein [Streptosporangiaceae bacterium]|jgi:molybdopterin-guanine dinucleotide biosynthesis protein A